MNQFNYLPPEIIEFIFKKVKFNDLINLRIVDKRFKQICEQIKIKQLILSDCNRLSKFWFYTNDPIYVDNENQIKIPKFLNYKSIFQLNKYLKRLSIKQGDAEDFNISILNEFKLLEQLQMIIYQLNDNYKLSLENLKIATIQYKLASDFKLTLDTNQLFAFNSSFKLDQFVFNYPDKILFYETYYHRFKYDSKRIESFSNLQHLKLIDLVDPIEEDILSKFKNLRILDLVFSDESINDLDDFIISTILHLVWSNRSELEIYLNGVKLINQNQNLNQMSNLGESLLIINSNYLELINQNQNLNGSVLIIYPNCVKLIDQNQNLIQMYEFKWIYKGKNLKHDLLEFQISNYDLLKDCNTDEIDYCDLIELIKIIPSTFTNKFYNIHKIKANNRVDNEDQFIKFLNGSPYLTKLELMNCGLTKSFYDQLIDFVYLNNLEHLVIKEDKELGLNFDFILNLKKLKNFQTNQLIDNHIDLISKLPKAIKCIQEFVFKFDTKNYIQMSFFFSYIKMKFFHLDDNLEKVFKFYIDTLNLEFLNLEDLILKLRNMKI